MEREKEEKTLESQTSQTVSNYISICLELVARYYDKDEYEFKEEALYLVNSLKTDGRLELAEWVEAQIFPNAEHVWTVS